MYDSVTPSGLPGLYCTVLDTLNNTPTQILCLCTNTVFFAVWLPGKNTSASCSKPHRLLQWRRDIVKRLQGQQVSLKWLLHLCVHCRKKYPLKWQQNSTHYLPSFCLGSKLCPFQHYYCNNIPHKDLISWSILRQNVATTVSPVFSQSKWWVHFFVCGNVHVCYLEGAFKVNFNLCKPATL